MTSVRIAGEERRGRVGLVVERRADRSCRTSVRIEFRSVRHRWHRLPYRPLCRLSSRRTAITRTVGTDGVDGDVGGVRSQHRELGEERELLGVVGDLLLLEPTVDLEVVVVVVGPFRTQDVAPCFGDGECVCARSRGSSGM